MAKTFLLPFLILAAGAAQAADPPAAPPAATAAKPAAEATPAMIGPLVQGVCLFSQNRLIAESQAGKAAQTRIQAMILKARSDLQGEQQKLEARGKALAAKRAALSPMQFEAQAKAIEERGRALQADAADREKQLQGANDRMIGQVIDLARPILSKAYAAHGCGLLLARESAIAGNFGNDLTGEVIAGLDAAGPPAAK